MSSYPQTWTITNLFEVCQPRQWKTISTKELTQAGYTVYGANGVIGFYNQYTHEAPTLMITCRGATCGNLHISKPFSYINGNAMALDHLNESICCMSYLHRFLQARGFDDVISGSAQPQITQEGLRKVDIPIARKASEHKIYDHKNDHSEEEIIVYKRANCYRAKHSSSAVFGHQKLKRQQKLQLKKLNKCY